MYTVDVYVSYLFRIFAYLIDIFVILISRNKICMIRVTYAYDTHKICGRCCSFSGVNACGLI